MAITQDQLRGEYKHSTGLPIRSNIEQKWYTIWLEKKLIESKLSGDYYIIERIKNKDGTITINRTCKGFHAIELLGYLEQVQMEILEQMRGKIKPNVINRNYIKDEEE